ncbi:MAG: YkvA family protein [Bacteroidota bacterium]
MMDKNIFKKYADKFSELKLWEKLKNYAKQAGQKTVYTVLLLYFAFKRNDTPAWAKRVVLGALGYFLSPIDGIPDLTPFLGYTDDLGVLSFGLVLIAGYINDEVREKARAKMTKWFGEINEAELQEIDEQL